MNDEQQDESSFNRELINIADNTDESSSNDKDQKLAHFQEITSLDDLDQCLDILNTNNWNLDSAIQSYFNRDLVIDATTTTSSNNNNEQIIQTTSYSIGPQVITSSIGSSSSSASHQDSHQFNQNLISHYHHSSFVIPNDLLHPRPHQQHQQDQQLQQNTFYNPILNEAKRLLQFNIEFNGIRFKLHVHDNEPVHKLKELIESSIKVPVEYQKLNGWKDKDAKVTDHMLLRDLNLPLENNLYVINSDANRSDVPLNNNGIKNSNSSSSSSGVCSSSLNTKIDLFELNFQILNNKKLSSENTTTATTPTTTTSTSQSLVNLNNDDRNGPYNNNNENDDINNKHKQLNKFNFNSLITKKNSYRLNFNSTESVIEIKRRVAKLAAISANEQEWWYFFKENSDESINSKSIGDLINENLLLKTPLSSLFNDDISLLDMKCLLETTTESQIKTSSSNTSDLSSLAKNRPIYNYYSNFNNNTIEFNSKLTPSNATATTTANNQKICKMSFLVSSKLGDIEQQFNMTQTSPSASSLASNPFIALGFEPLMQDIVSAGTSAYLEQQSILSKKPKTDDDDFVIINDKQNNNADIKKYQSMNEETNDEFETHVDADEEDLDEHFLLEPTIKQKSLIPSSCPANDEYLGTSSFVEEFFKRYGPIVPLFYVGTLEDAIKEALMCSARDRKLLGIYLHTDNSVSKHIFCSKTLCDENVVNFLTANFVVWPWDLTNKEQETHFYNTCSKYLGSVAVSHFRNSKTEFPMFLIVTRVRSTNEVISVIESRSTSEDMIHRLMQAYEMFESQRIKDERDEQTRDERERIKREQDAAYQASLEFDKAKRQRQTEENEKQRLAAQQEQEREKQRINEREKRIRDSIQSVPNEPGHDSPTNQITRIRFRLPTGETLQRKFFITDKLSAIINYVHGNGYFSEEYKLLSSWPRRDLTNEPTERTIEDLKLFPQETLTLEQR